MYLKLPRYMRFNLNSSFKMSSKSIYTSISNSTSFRDPQFVKTAGNGGQGAYGEISDGFMPCKHPECFRYMPPVGGGSGTDGGSDGYYYYSTDAKCIEFDSVVEFWGDSCSYQGSDGQFWCTCIGKLTMLKRVEMHFRHGQAYSTYWGDTSCSNLKNKMVFVDYNCEI